MSRKRRPRRGKQDRKPGNVTIKRADGSVEVVKPQEIKTKGKRPRSAPKRSTRYHEYLHSPEWREKRRTGCGLRVELHVHHLTYERLGQEPLEDLTTLCKTCHRVAHDT